MSNQSLPDIRSEVAELKRHLLDMMADEQRLYQRYVEADREAARWRRRAELAVARGTEDLARAALLRSARHAAEAGQFHEQFLEQKGHVEWMKTRLLEREAGLVRPVSRGGFAGIARLEEELARLERRAEAAREERARLAAWAELERDELAERLDALEREDTLDRQLAELKARQAVRGG